MQTVVDDGYLEQPVPIEMREAEEVHGGIIHAEKYRKGLCLLTSKEMGMRRLAVTIGARKEVKVIVGSFQIGIDANEPSVKHLKRDVLAEEVEERLVVHVHQLAIEGEPDSGEGYPKAHQTLLHQFKVNIVNLLHPKPLEVWIELDSDATFL